MNRTHFLVLFICLFFMVLLSACQFSLAGDITPLPGAEQQIPTLAQTPTEIVSSPGVTPIEQVTAQPEGTPGASEASKTGKVAGQVINGSGGKVPPDLTITLHGFNQMSETFLQDTLINPNGTFKFTEVTFKKDLIYVATVEYGGVTYNSEITMVDESMQNLDLPIKIYETTTDASVLIVDRLHVFFEFLNPETVRVVHLYVIFNTGNRTVTAASKGGAVVSFNLPKDVVNLQFQDGVLGERFIQTDSGFADTKPISPGSGGFQVVYSFDMPYKKKLELSEQMFLPVSAVIVMMPVDGAKIQSDKLEDIGTRNIQGQVFQTYTGENIAANSSLTLTLAGRLDGVPIIKWLTAPSSSTFLVIGVGGLGLALVIAGVFLYLRNKKEAEMERRESDTLAGQAEDSYEDADTVMDAIITLDDMYNDGELSETAYQERRSKLKESLKELLDEEDQSPEE